MFGFGKKRHSLTPVQAVMQLHGVSEGKARRMVQACRDDLYAAIDSGAMEELADIVRDDLGLDPSYVDDLL